MRSKIRALIGAGIALGLLSGFPSLAHQNHNHPSAATDEKRRGTAEQMRLERINESYVRDIRPIFENSCLDCHSSNTRYPWYYKLPFARNWIDEDITEAKKHLDMTDGFPFEGHGTPKEDLKAIEDVIEEGTMPPFRYWILQWGARLNEREKKQILDWVSESQLLLDQPG